VSFNASRSVQTDMNSALQVGQRIVKGALAQLPESTDRRRDLVALVAAFKHLMQFRVLLVGTRTSAFVKILNKKPGRLFRSRRSPKKIRPMSSKARSARARITGGLAMSFILHASRWTR
jgi:hypothetical protein